MQKIKKIYRSDYQGEDVVKDLIYQNTNWTRNTEFVPNNVINNQTVNRAVIIGNGPSRKQLYPLGDLFGLLANHRAGLFGSEAIQTYGCNALYRDFSPNFLVANGPEITKEIAESGYCESNIVYSDGGSVLDYPRKFYLTPQSPSWDAGAIAAYIACFDGHKKLYMIGFDGHSGQATEHYNIYNGTNGYPEFQSSNTEAFFIKSMSNLMDLYNDVEFIRVMPTPNWWCPEEWKFKLNFRQIEFRDFVLEVDL
jgi:hypothetical protein